MLQEKGYFSVKAGIFDPFFDIFRICVHFFDVGEHKNFALLAGCELFVEAKCLNDVDLLSLLAMLLVIFDSGICFSVALGS